MRLQSRCEPGLQVQPRKDQLPTSLCLLVGFCSSPVVGPRALVPHWLLVRGFLQFFATRASLHKAALNMAAAFHENKQVLERAREAEQEGSQSFSVTQYKNEHAPNNILFIRSKSLSPAHTERRRIHKGEYLKMRITGNHCRIYPPHIHWVLWLDMGYCQCVYSLISVHSQEPLYCLPGDSIYCWMSFSGGNQEC